MSSISTLLVSDASSDINSRIEKLIRSHPELNFEGHINKQLAPETIKGHKNILVWYELDTNTELSMTALQRLVGANPSSYFIVSKSSLDPELVKVAMKIGVLDFLDYERADVQLKSVIRRISALHDAESRAAAPATSQAVEKRSQLKTSENLMQTGKWADFDFKKLQEGAAEADRLTESARVVEAPVQAAPQAPPPPSPAPPPPPVPKPAASATSKWGDLDAIGSPSGTNNFTNTGEDAFITPADVAAASDISGGGNKWGDLDSIPTPGATSGATPASASAAPAQPQVKGLGSSSLGMKSTDNLPKTASKWGDLDSVGSGGSGGATHKKGQIDPAVLAPTPPPTFELSEIGAASAEAGADGYDSLNPNPYAQLDEIGSGKSKWGDLDAIGSPGNKSFDSPAPQSSPSQNINPYAQLDEVETLPGQNPGQSKWGDLDAIGTPAASAPKGAGQIDPAVLKPTPPPTNSKWGDLDAIGTPAASAPSAPVGAGQIDPAVLKPTPPPTNSKWGDLDAIGGAPGQQQPQQAKTEPMASEPKGGLGGKWGNLDSIGTPSAKAQPASNPAPSVPSRQADAASSGGAGKWGNLDSIPTPKKASSAPIPMQDSESAPARAPIPLSGPRAAESRSSSASKKWVGAGEHGESAPKMSSLRDGKAAKVSIKVGWDVWRILIALGLTTSAVALSFKFFIY